MNKLLAMLTTALLCGGCAEVTRLQSSWYIVDNRGQAETYVAILNHGNTTVTLQRLIVNPVRSEIWLINDPQRDGWELPVAMTLTPGQVFTTRLEAFSTPPLCRLPIEIDVELKERRWLFVTDMKPALPSQLPYGWQPDCRTDTN
jgi:hypothetical protein